MAYYAGLTRLTPITEPGLVSPDGMAYTDKLLVRDCLVKLLLTKKGSRVYDPAYGTELHKLIFESNIARIQNAAKLEIKNAVKTYEPRVEIGNVTAELDQNYKDKLIVKLEVFYKELGVAELLTMTVRK